MRLKYTITLPTDKTSLQINFEDPAYEPLTFGDYGNIKYQHWFLGSFLSSQGEKRLELLKEWTENHGFDQDEAIFTNYTLSFAKDWGFTVLLVPQYDYFNAATVRLDIENNIVHIIPHHSIDYVEPFDIAELLPDKKIYSYPAALYLAFLRWWSPIKEDIQTRHMEGRGFEDVELSGEWDTESDETLPHIKKCNKCLLEYGQQILEKKLAIRAQHTDDWHNEQVIAAWLKKITQLRASHQEEIYAKIQKLLDELIDLEHKDKKDDKFVLVFVYDPADKKNIETYISPQKKIGTMPSSSKPSSR